MSTPVLPVTSGPVAYDPAGPENLAFGSASQRLRAVADLLEDLDRGPSAQGLVLPRERRRDAPVTVDADQLRLVADLLEHPAFGA